MGSLIAGTAIMALLVTVFEFSCTGQVYLPVIMHLARSEGRASAYGLLVLYNTAFIIPLISVFGLSYAGVRSKSMADFFSKRIAGIKYLLALVFAGMAVLTLLT
jgi:cytochrome c biogenesis protein CcdA